MLAMRVSMGFLLDVQWNGGVIRPCGPERYCRVGRIYAALCY